jgi:hypothetical protein
MTQEQRSQLLSESSHSSSATESAGSLTPTPPPSYSSLEASLRSVASICGFPCRSNAEPWPNSSTMSRLGLDPDTSAVAVLPQKKSFRNRRPLAIETSWDTITTADEPSSYIQHPPTPKNSQSGNFFDPSPRSVLDSSDSSTRQFF